MPFSTDKLALGAAIAVAAMMHTASSATFTEYIDKTEWQKAVGEWTTIGFADLPWGTHVTTEYSDLGVIFTDGDDQVFPTSSFLEDGWGLEGSTGFDPDDSINLEFAAPIHWIGVDYPRLCADGVIQSRGADLHHDVV